jgi:hypothetical protein
VDRRQKVIGKQKKVFIALFLGFSLILLILPFLVSFNEVLTRIVEQNFLYLWVQNNVVPLEAKMMGAILMPFGYDYAFSPTSSSIVVNDIGRMLFTILLAVHAPPIFRIVFHDYLAAGTTLIWLFAFWWFTYSYVLVDRVVETK